MDNRGPDRLSSERRGNAASSRNPPKRLERGPVLRLSAVGISGLQAGEDVNALSAKAFAGEWFKIPLPNLAATERGVWRRTAV